MKIMSVILHISKMREKRGMSYRQVSRITGISKSMLERIEKGEKSPSIDQLELLAKAFNCKINDLVKSPFLRH